MKRRLNWKTVLITAGIVLLILVILPLIVDGILKSVIQSQGSRAVGARVDLSDAHVGLFPVGITLTGLRVTNPNTPMRNAVAIGRIRAAVEVIPLFKKRIIIDEMSMDGVRFDTPRKTSGALPGAPPPKPATAAGCDATRLPGLNTRDVAHILDTESLRSMDLSKSLVKDIAEQKKAWSDRLAALPGPATIDQYRKRIDALTAGGNAGAIITGLLAKPQAVTDLKRDITRDFKRLQTARQDLGREMGNLKQKTAAVREASTGDVSRLVQKYAVSRGQLGNLSRSLFGGAFCGWAGKAVTAYEWIAPRIASHKKAAGEKTSKAPSTPIFVLVKQARIGVETDRGRITGELRDITSDPAALGIPMTCKLAGDHLKGLDQIRVTGVLDHVHPARHRDQLNVAVKGLRLSDLRLAAVGDELPVTIKKGLADVDLVSRVTGDQINARLTVDLHRAAIAIPQSPNAGPMAAALATALGGIDHLNATAEVTGPIDNYRVDIHSEMDRLLRERLSSVVTRQAESLRKALSDGLAQRLAPTTGEARTQLTAVNGIDAELGRRLNLLNGIKLPM